MVLLLLGGVSPSLPEPFGGIAQAAPQSGASREPAQDRGSELEQALENLGAVLFRTVLLIAIPVELVLFFWQGARRYRWKVYGVAAILVLILLGVGFVRGYRNAKRRAEDRVTATRLAAEPTPAAERTAPAAATAPNAPQAAVDERQVFKANGCELKAPATWTPQAQPPDSRAKLVVVGPQETASVGISAEPATGNTLTKKEIASLMEKAASMPLRLEDSNWSTVDNHEAWREVRVGTMRGTSRVWIRYSYKVDAALMQVIAVGQIGARNDRDLLESIIRSVHCEN